MTVYGPVLSLSALFVASDIHLHIRLDTYKAACWRSSESYYAPALWGHFGIARSVRLSVPWRSCLGCRHAGCLQISHRRLPKICGQRTRPRTDVDPPRFFCHRRTAIGGGAYRLAAPGAIPCFVAVGMSLPGLWL